MIMLWQFIHIFAIAILAVTTGQPTLVPVKSRQTAVKTIPVVDKLPSIEVHNSNHHQVFAV